MTTISTIIFDRPMAKTVNLTGRLKARSFRWTLAKRFVDAIDYVARGIYHLYRFRRYYTLLKLTNMAAANIAFYFKAQRVWARPYRMKIESTNICNTHCQLCPTGLQLNGRPKGKMTFEQFKKLIDGFKWHLVDLDLSMWGDPLIVPDIYKMIRYAHDRGIWTYISSNLHAFKPDKGHAQMLVKSGLDLMTCSLHGATQQTFELYQPGKNFGDAVEKVRHIIETRNRMGSATPQVQLNFVVTQHNEHELDAFEKLADELGCKAVFSAPSMNVRFVGQDKNLVDLGLADDVKKQKQNELIAKWLPTDSRYAIEPYRKMLQGHDHDPNQWNGKKLFNCDWPWRSTVINWDGNVAACCGGFDSKEDLGNIFDQPFAKVWNGPTYRMARRSFKKPLTAKQSKDNPCATCPGIML